MPAKERFLTGSPAFGTIYELTSTLYLFGHLSIRPLKLSGFLMNVTYETSLAIICQSYVDRISSNHAIHIRKTASPLFSSCMRI